MSQKRKYRKALIQGHNQMRLEYIGGLLREYRFDSMLSREDFASEHGISRSLLERIETGKNVTVHSLLRVCDIFQLSPEEVFEGVE